MRLEREFRGDFVIELVAGGDRAEDLLRKQRRFGDDEKEPVVHRHDFV